MRQLLIYEDEWMYINLNFHDIYFLTSLLFFKIFDQLPSPHTPRFKKLAECQMTYALLPKICQLLKNQQYSFFNLAIYRSIYIKTLTINYFP